MNNDDFLTQLENCTLPKEYFTHRSHLRLAWLYLSRYPFDCALEKILASIYRYASSLGAAAIFHVTLTQAWVRLVNEAMQHSKADQFEQFLEQSPWLLNKTLPTEYYSQAVLESAEARASFICPDIKTFDAK